MIAKLRVDIDNSWGLSYDFSVNDEDYKGVRDNSSVIYKVNNRSIEFFKEVSKSLSAEELNKVRENMIKDFLKVINSYRKKYLNSSNL